MAARSSAVHLIGISRLRPNPMRSDSEIEIRPYYEMEDFGDALPKEVAELEKEWREKNGR